MPHIGFTIDVRQVVQRHPAAPPEVAAPRVRFRDVKPYSAPMSLDELLDLVCQSDSGFNLEWFTKNLEHVDRIQPEEVRIYDVSPACRGQVACQAMGRAHPCTHATRADTHTARRAHTQQDQAQRRVDGRWRRP